MLPFTSSKKFTEVVNFTNSSELSGHSNPNDVLADCELQYS